MSRHRIIAWLSGCLFASACAVSDDDPAADGGSAGAAAHSEALVIGTSQYCVLTATGPVGRETAFEAYNSRTTSLARQRPPTIGTRTTLLRGTCASQPDTCNVPSEPVCASLSKTEPSTFDSRCALRVAVLNAAGDNGQASASVDREGACTQSAACFSSTQCAADEYCTVEDGVCERPPGCDVVDGQTIDGDPLSCIGPGEACRVAGDDRSDPCCGNDVCVFEACTNSIPPSCFGHCTGEARVCPAVCAGTCAPRAKDPA